MTRFIPREKMSKKARRALDAGRRRTWAVPPVTRKIESRKMYSRKRISHERETLFMGFLFSGTALNEAAAPLPDPAGTHGSPLWQKPSKLPN